MDPAMAGEAERHDILKIIEPLADPSPLVMHLSRQLPADLALEMFPQKRQPQPAVFAQSALPYAAYRPEPFLTSLQGASFH
jgi:hypothetical protein